MDLSLAPAIYLYSQCKACQWSFSLYTTSFFFQFRPECIFKILCCLSARRLRKSIMWQIMFYKNFATAIFPHFCILAEICHSPLRRKVYSPFSQLTWPEEGGGCDMVWLLMTARQRWYAFMILSLTLAPLTQPPCCKEAQISAYREAHMEMN